MTNQTTKRKSFIIHKDSLSILNKLSDQQAGKLFKTISNYQADLSLPEDTLISIIFEPFLNQFLRDEEKYLKTCEARSLAGSKGGKQKVANASNCKQNVANVAESDSKSDSKKEVKSKKPKGFISPTLEEVKKYCQERGNSVNPKKFFDYYSAGNWKDSKGNAVKNWKQKLLNWESKDDSISEVQDPVIAKLNAIAKDNYFKSVKIGEKAVITCFPLMKTKAYKLSEAVKSEIKAQFKQLIEIK